MKKKSADELLMRYVTRRDWKSLKLWSWVEPYEKAYKTWSNLFPPVSDDRRLFINTFDMVYHAIDSLSDNPDSWICCAVLHEVEKEKKVMFRILKQFPIK